MTIGPGVLLLPLLNPLQVAEEIATLDAITGGRVALGVGIGYRDVELAGFGVTGKPSKVFEEKLDVLRRLLAGEEVTASGPGYTLDGARLSLLPSRPVPVWVAANRDAAVRRAARVGDAWLMNPHTTLDELERQHGVFVAAREEAGLPAPEEVPALREVCVAPTDEEAMLRRRPPPGGQVRRVRRLGPERRHARRRHAAQGVGGADGGRAVHHRLARDGRPDASPSTPSVPGSRTSSAGCSGREWSRSPCCARCGCSSRRRSPPRV